MPTYEYACTSCKRHFEVVQRFSDEPLETCEVCGGKLKRVFHPVGIVLKGSGFYSTDHRSDKKFKPGAGKEAASEKAEKGSGSEKSSEKSSDKSSSSEPAGGASGSGDAKSSST